jgi:hypothetical protein
MENTKGRSIGEHISILKTVKSVFINLKEEGSGSVVDSEEFQTQIVLEINSNHIEEVDKDFLVFDGILGGKWE